MSVAVVGHNGRLGKWLVEHHDCVPLRVDMLYPEMVMHEVERIKPNVIINCGAFTMVDKAEEIDSRDLALAINTRGPANLRRSFFGLFVHLSTGFVFPGEKGPYKEDDHREPVNWYGWTKEAAMMRDPMLVVRTLDLYTPDSSKGDFVRAMRDILELGVEKSLPDHLFKTPTYVPHLAEGVMVAIEKGITGFLHIAGSQTMSTLEWGKMIAEHFGYDPDLLTPGKVEGLAKRPLRGGLNVERARTLDVPIYSPEDGLKALSEWEAGDAE
jgi:dTDP-4-dehydrorhamnose reductase